MRHYSCMGKVKKDGNSSLRDVVWDPGSPVWRGSEGLVDSCWSREGAARAWSGSMRWAYAVNGNVRFKSSTFSRKYETEYDSRTGGSFEAKYSTSSTL